MFSPRFSVTENRLNFRTRDDRMKDTVPTIFHGYGVVFLSADAFRVLSRYLVTIRRNITHVANFLGAVLSQNKGTMTARTKILNDITLTAHLSNGKRRGFFHFRSLPIQLFSAKNLYKNLIKSP